jgi:hypothetical protein
MSTLKTVNLKHESSGSNNIVLDSSGNTTVSGNLTVSGTNGFFQSYAIICDQKSAGTGGGATVANTWTARDLNTEIADPDSIVSIASNRFTLGAGDYLIKWSSPFFYTNRMITRLYDHTNTAVKQYGMSAYVPGSSGEQVPSLGWARISPTGSTAYEIQYYADNADSDGLGHDSPDDVSTTIYTVVEIFKES